MKHICTEMTLGVQIVTECVCGVGFYKTNVHGNCYGERGVRGVVRGG